MALLASDVFSEPARGPLGVAVTVGTIAWGVAGATTLGGSRVAIGLIVWCTAYAGGLWLGAMWGNWFEQNRVGGVSDAGFAGALLGWAVGAFAGAFASTWSLTPSRFVIRPLLFATAWSLSFLFAGYVGLVAGMLLGQVSKTLLAFPGLQGVALAIGWGLGFALGGWLGSALGLASWRALGPFPPGRGVQPGANHQTFPR
jgi:hypothetical protein